MTQPGSNLSLMSLCRLVLCVLIVPAVAAGATAKWGRAAPLPEARGEVAAALAGGRIYVVGGFAADGLNSPRVDAYNPRTNRWQRAPDLPLPVDHTMAAGYRGHLYVVGGYGPGQSVLGTLFELSGNTWTRLPPMPEERAAGGAVVVNGMLYVVGGISASIVGDQPRTLAKQTLVYDIARRRWSALPGTAPREHLAVTTLNGRIYSVGGRKAGADTNLNIVEVYRPGGRRWQRLRSIPRKRGGTGAAGIGRWIVSVGGETPTATIRTVYRYNVKRRRWSRLPNLPTPRHGLGVVGFGRRVYVLGGGTRPGLSVSSANEFLTIR